MALFVVLTDEEAARAEELDDDDNAAVAPRLIDGTGAPAELQGKQVLPQQIVDDPDYQRHCPALVTFLLTLPAMELDPEVIFAPSEDFDC